jgi:hypothetical protein
MVLVWVQIDQIKIFDLQPFEVTVGSGCIIITYILVVLMVFWGNKGLFHCVFLDSEIKLKQIE